MTPETEQSATGTDCSGRLGARLGVAHPGDTDERIPFADWAHAMTVVGDAVELMAATTAFPPIVVVDMFMIVDNNGRPWQQTAPGLWRSGSIVATTSALNRRLTRKVNR